MHQASPVRGWEAWTIRYRTGSRRLMFGEAMSTFARRTRAPFANSPARMRAKRSRLSSTDRERNGESEPGAVSVPRVSRISSADWSSTKASPFSMRWTAQA
jgi:hypothetical protein